MYAFLSQSHVINYVFVKYISSFKQVNRKLKNVPYYWVHIRLHQQANFRFKGKVKISSMSNRMVNILFMLAG